jgi:predicted restriction endonuclease
MKIRFTGDEENVKLAEKCVEIYLGDYTPEQQYSATIILHMLLKDPAFDQLLDYLRENTGFRVNDRNSGKVLTWKKKVKKIGKCDICGATKELVAHHVVPWKYSIKGRTDVNNGQCLCTKCHKIMHDDFLWLKYMREKTVRSHGKKETCGR